MLKSFAVALLLAGGALLASCASDQPPSGEPIMISKQVEDHYQKYLNDVAAGRQGAFAVSINGNAAHYSICESGTCNGQYNFSSQAIKGCEKFGRGRCVVLASNGILKRPYKVVDAQSDLLEQLQAALQPQFVSGDRIRKELIGNSIVDTGGSGKIWAEYYDPNGTVRGRNQEGAKFAGNWKIDGNTLCVDYSSIGEDWCGQFAEGDDGAIDYYKDGKFRKTYPKSTLQAGNPQHL